VSIPEGEIALKHCERHETCESGRQQSDCDRRTHALALARLRD
jgi:hypothetical protein